MSVLLHAISISVCCLSLSITVVFLFVWATLPEMNSLCRIERVSYLIYVSVRHYVITTAGDIVVCFHTAVCLSC